MPHRQPTTAKVCPEVALILASSLARQLRRIGHDAGVMSDSSLEEVVADLVRLDLLPSQTTGDLLRMITVGRISIEGKLPKPADIKFVCRQAPALVTLLEATEGHPTSLAANHSHTAPL